MKASRAALSFCHSSICRTTQRSVLLSPSPSPSPSPSNASAEGCISKRPVFWGGSVEMTGLDAESAARVMHKKSASRVIYQAGLGSRGSSRAGNRGRVTISVLQNAVAAQARSSAPVVFIPSASASDFELRGHH